MEFDSLKERAILALIENFEINQQFLDTTDEDIKSIFYMYVKSPTAGQRFLLAVQNHHFIIANKYAKLIPKYQAHDYYSSAYLYGVETGDNTIKNLLINGQPLSILAYIQVDRNEMFATAAVRAKDVNMFREYSGLIDTQEISDELQLEVIYSQNVKMLDILTQIDGYNSEYFVTNLYTVFSGRPEELDFIMESINEELIDIDQLLTVIVGFPNIGMDIDATKVLVKTIVKSNYNEYNIENLFMRQILYSDTSRWIIKMFIVDEDIAKYNQLVRVPESYVKDAYNDALYVDDNLSRLFHSGVMLEQLYKTIFKNNEYTSNMQPEEIERFESTERVIIEDLIIDWLIIGPEAFVPGNYY